MDTYQELIGANQALKEQLADQPDALQVEQVLSLVKRVREAGTSIGDPQQRDQLREILKSWGPFVYERRGEYSATQLAPYEPSDTASKSPASNLGPDQQEVSAPRLRKLQPAWLVIGALVLLIAALAYLVIPRSSPVRQSLLADLAPQLAQIPSAQIIILSAWPDKAFAVQYCGCNEGDVHNGTVSAKIVFGSLRNFWGVWGINDLMTYDAQKFGALSFWVKGQKGGEHFYIKLKYRLDSKEYEGAVDSNSYLAVATTWQKASIPLIDFERLGVPLDKLQGLNFGFNDNTGNATIFIDDILFEAKR